MLICSSSKPEASNKQIRCASGACPTEAAHTSTFIWQIFGGSGESAVGGKGRGWGALGALIAGARRVREADQ